MNTKTGREKPRFYRGVLENAGLGEAAFFLKKAKQDVLYAATAIEHTDFSAIEVAGLQGKIDGLRNLIAEVSGDIENAESGLAAAVAQREFSDDDEVAEQE